MIDEDTKVETTSQDLTQPDLGPKLETQPPRPSSRSRSTNTTSSNSRASSPLAQSSELSSLSSCPSFTPEPEPIVEASEVFDTSSIEVSIRRSTRNQRDTDSIIPQDTIASSQIAIDESIISDLAPSLQQEESILSITTNDSDTLPNTQTSQTSKSLPNLKGRDLFDCMVWKDPLTTSIFYMFIASLRQKVLEVEETSETHKFIRALRDGGRLARNYTQNIDLLEEREGLCTDLTAGTGIRSKSKRESEHVHRIRGCETVPLHGTLSGLRCGLCSKSSDWDEPARKDAIQAGVAPDCPHCSEYNAKRVGANRRGAAVGRLRPDIVLYGEEHPHATLISTLITSDLGLALDVLLIMGTSLRVHGLKIMVREFAKAVHARGGTVVFVNRTKPSESSWGDVIDYWVEMDCDQWVLDLKDRREDIWKPFGSTTEAPKRRQSTTDAKPARKRPQALRDDKINGAYITFKILDSLIKLKDNEGIEATRHKYWVQPAPKPSNASVLKTEPAPKPDTAKTKKAAPMKKPNPKAAAAKAKTAKRQSLPASLDDPKNFRTRFVSNMWEELREKAPGLPAVPPELRQPFEKFVGNKTPFFKSFANFADASTNCFPNIYKSKPRHSLEAMNMNLTHLPPKGFTLPKQKPQVVEKTAVQRIINHSYGTRASRRVSSIDEIADTIVVESPSIITKSPLSLDISATSSDSPVLPSIETTTLPSPTSVETPPVHDMGETIELEDTIIVDEPPLTPSASRIKRLSSIGNLVSSPEEGQSESGSGEETFYDASEVLMT